MKYLALFVLAAVFASVAAAEEWIDFNSRVVGMGSAGAILGRGPSGVRYNPANSAARPWETGEESLLTIQFDVPSGFSAAAHGDDFNRMFEVVEAANDIQDQFENGAFNNPTTADLGDYREAFSIFNNLDLLDSLNGEGVYSNAYVGIGARVGNLFLDGDGLTVTFGGFSIASAAVVVDFESLRNYRFVDESGANWDLMVNGAAALSGQVGAGPSTPEGQQFSADLQAAGYPAAEADVLAKTAEDSGINFGGVGASILFDFLVNTRNGTGQSLESGADPLEGNQSGFVIRGLAFYEVGLSYGFPIPIPIVRDYLSIGGTLRLIQAYTFSERLTVSEMTGNGIRSTFESLGEQVGDAYSFKGNARFNVGVDLGVVFTPFDTLAFTVVGRNLNGPEFRWKPDTNGEPKLVRFDPQFVVGASYTAFDSVGLPLTFAVEGEVNKISSDILPNFNTQFVRGGIGWEPQLGPVGFGLRVGGFKNLADADQAFTLTFGAGFRLWVFHLDFAGQLGLDTQKFGTDKDNEIIPQRFGASLTLGIHIEF